MRQSTTKARRFEPERDLGGSAHAAVRVHRTDPLRLPVIPQEAIMDLGTPQEAAFALHWLDAGFLDDSMIAVSATKLVETGFAQWAQKWAGELSGLTSMTFSYSMKAGISYSEDESSPNDWSFAIDLDGVPCRFLEPRFNIIEPKAPGLFQTALSVFDEVVSKIGMSGTPEMVRYMAEYALWHGTSTDEALQEELECEGLEPSDIEGRLTPSDFDNGLPAWLISTTSSSDEEETDQKPTHLSTDALIALSSSSDSEIASIAQSVLVLLGCLEAVDGVVEHPEDEDQIYPLTLLRWNASDAVRRAYDDIVEGANSCGGGYTATLVAENVGSDNESFREWRERYEPVLTALKHASRLVELLSVPDDD